MVHDNAPEAAEKSGPTIFLRRPINSMTELNIVASTLDSGSEIFRLGIVATVVNEYDVTKTVPNLQGFLDGPQAN